MFRQWRMNWLLLVAATALDLCLVANHSGAQAPDEDGRKFFEIGAQAYGRGQYEAAISAFHAAYELNKRPGLLFSLAQAHRRAYETQKRPQDLNAAIRYYDSFLATHPVGERAEQAERFLQQLKQQPAATAEIDPAPVEATRTVLVVAATVSGARLQLDDLPLRSLPYAAALSPGRHALKVTAAGYAPYEKEVEVVEGRQVDINVTLVRSAWPLSITGNRGAIARVDGHDYGMLPLAPLSIGIGPHTVEVREPGHLTVRLKIDHNDAQHFHLAGKPTTKRTAAWLLLGTGAAGIATGGVLGYVAINKDSAAQRLERDDPNNYVAFNQTVRSRNNFRLAAGISAGLGAAAAVGGLWAYFSDGPGPVQQQNTLGWLPELKLSNQAMSLDLQYRF